MRLDKHSKDGNISDKLILKRKNRPLMTIWLKASYHKSFSSTYT